MRMLCQIIDGKHFFNEVCKGISLTADFVIKHKYISVFFCGPGNIKFYIEILQKNIWNFFFYLFWLKTIG